MTKSQSATLLSDWHPADVRAEIVKSGTTLSRLSREHGYDESAVGKAMRQPWPAVERIIAARLRVAPAAIWPTRYDRHGNPLRERVGQKRIYATTQAQARNVQAGRGA